MRLTISIAVCAVLACSMFSAIGAQSENAIPAYAVEITLTNRATKMKEFSLTAKVAAGKTKVIRDIRQRPFVTGFSDSTANTPVIQIVDCGATADFKISETEAGAFVVDATVELSEVSDVSAKRYPGSEKMVQAIRIQATKTRLIDTVSLNEKLKSTLNIDGRTYDVALTVGRGKLK